MFELMKLKQYHLSEYAMKFINIQLQIKSCDNIKHRWSKTVVKDHLFSKTHGAMHCQTELIELLLFEMTSFYFYF